MLELLLATQAIFHAAENGPLLASLFLSSSSPTERRTSFATSLAVLISGFVEANVSFLAQPSADLAPLYAYLLHISVSQNLSVRLCSFQDLMTQS